MGNIWKWFVLVLLLTGCGGNPDYVPVPTPELPPPYTGETCMSANALLLAGGTPLIAVDAADFDGTNDYMSRAGLSGVSSSKSGILSFWYRIDGGNATARTLLEADDTPGAAVRFQVQQAADNKIWLNGYNSADATILALNSTAYAAAGTWLHILSAWDLANNVSSLYINGVSDQVAYRVNDFIAYTGVTDTALGSSPGGSLKINGCLAEFYFAPNQYLDFSVEANRRKFISGAGGKPVHLGVDGSLPTGTAPAIYQHLDNEEAVANFATNRGTGGNFTITGTLDTASTSPSD